MALISANCRTIYDPTGAPFAENLTPEAFCSGLRQLIEGICPLPELEALALHNKESIARLRNDAPALKTAKRVHYADILQRLIKDRLAPPAAATSANAEETPLPASPPLAPSRIASGPRIDKSVLAIGTERRLRDKAHLQFVATKPCLICDRKPTHAHHLTYAERRGIDMKVSDEFTVPLCAVHHDQLHRSGAERSWWGRQEIDPLPLAAELWAESRALNAGSEPQPAMTDASAVPPSENSNRERVQVSADTEALSPVAGL